MKRRMIIALATLCAFIFILAIMPTTTFDFTSISQYIQDNSLLETGCTNGVTAIYLHYRLFDTLFEALLLLISIIGIVHFSRHEEGSHE